MFPVSFCLPHLCFVGTIIPYCEPEWKWELFRGSGENFFHGTCRNHGKKSTKTRHGTKRAETIGLRRNKKILSREDETGHKLNSSHSPTSKLKVFCKNIMELIYKFTATQLPPEFANSRLFRALLARSGIPPPSIPFSLYCLLYCSFLKLVY